jgi:hypothetical protein
MPVYVGDTHAQAIADPEAGTLLFGKSFACSKHGGVHAALGTHFANTGVVRPSFG